LSSAKTGVLLAEVVDVIDGDEGVKPGEFNDNCGSWSTSTTDPKNTSESSPSRFVFLSLLSSFLDRGLKTIEKQE
jgi:hypothetical protein